jgi:glycosyltransferase involved in cell wall biosynthesis
MQPTVNVVIATHNMKSVILDTIMSILDQDYPNKRIIVYDDCSTDGTYELLKPLKWLTVIRGKVNVGVGEAFNKGIERSTGKYVMLMCADDLFTNRKVISDMVAEFEKDEKVGYVTRWYYQFVHNHGLGPVRAWRGNDPIVLANNPSALMFRKKALAGSRCENKMFVETSALASQVLAKGWKSAILKYDAIAVRVWESTSTQPGYWLKRRVSSPVMDWTSIGGGAMAIDYVSFIQIKRGFKQSAVWEEVVNFVKVRPKNLLNPKFYFWAIVALVIPSKWAIALPQWYRNNIGRMITKEVKRG